MTLELYKTNMCYCTEEFGALWLRATQTGQDPVQTAPPLTQNITAQTLEGFYVIIKMHAKL